MNYYRLSAYGLGLSQKDDKEKYIDGISLEHIYRLYEFDSIFRNILIHVIEQLEIQLRTQISNFLALKYGSEGYVDPAHFTEKKTKNGEPVHTTVMESFNKEREHQKNAPFVKHHMAKYEGHFPVWVAVELFTFGNLSSLYSIMVLEDRKEIGVHEVGVTIRLIVALGIAIAERELESALGRDFAAELGSAVFDGVINRLIDSGDGLDVILGDDQRNAVLGIGAVDGSRLPHVLIGQPDDPGDHFGVVSLVSHNYISSVISLKSWLAPTVVIAGRLSDAGTSVGLPAGLMTKPPRTSLKVCLPMSFSISVMGIKDLR